MFFVLGLTPQLRAGGGNQDKGDIPSLGEIEKKVQEWMEIGEIPGLTLVIVRALEPEFIKGYGYADLESKTPVTPDTKFELASCSKSYTALAVLQLEAKGEINLDASVSDYLPWFQVNYNREEYPVTLRQCLHHSSGIPWETISKIPPDNSIDALEQTVRNLVGVELNSKPGTRFEYATINYDIVGAVIEKVSGKSYEEYMRDYVFTPLGLTSTGVGVADEIPLMATGYKYGFFRPREYEPPVFRGNYPAGYIVSNGINTAKWLKIQLGQIETEFSDLVQKTHQPNLNVPPDPNLNSYAMGWYINNYKNNEASHSGLNPNFSSYMSFKPKEKIGVAVLANSNSPYTQFIGQSVLRLLTGQEPIMNYPSRDKVDTFCSIISVVLGFYSLLIIFFILLRIIGVFRGKNKFEALTWKKAMVLSAFLLASLPFLYGIYLIPRAIARMSWDVVRVWAPVSFDIFVYLLLVSIGLSFVQFAFSLILPARSKYRKELPQIAIISMLSGLAGTALLFLVTTAFFSSVGLEYLLYYFLLVLITHVGGRKIAQTKMIKLSNNLALDLRIDLIHKLFTTKYQRFEKMEEGRIFTTLNDDTGVLAGTAGMIVLLLTNIVTAVSGFIYMTTISVSSTLVVVGVTIGLIFYYRFVAKSGRRFMEAARDAQNVYLSLLNGTLKGYKELSIHRRKKYEFKQDVIKSSEINANRNIMAGLKFLNANLIGDLFTIIVLGILSIVISRVVTGVNIVTLISFVMVLLYLLGPIRIILSGLPTITRLRVSWGRVKGFVRDLDARGSQESVKEFIKNLDIPGEKDPIPLEGLDYHPEPIGHLKVQGLMFAYKSESGEEGFSIGPVDFELNKGETLFLIGGNGSGKTTVAKLITGLYLSDKGSIKIDDQEVEVNQLGEYFSTIYSGFHLFKKIYGVDTSDKEADIQKYLQLLNLDQKVQVKDNEYSTLDMSGGQRKRLALFQCLMEDRPIYLFDEVAADQDPEFRRFFYRELLPYMKQAGKLVIAITHDDHYFDVADKVIKLDMGKVDLECKGEDFSAQMAITTDKSMELEK
jgi:cyclic peptide transporter